MKKLFPENLENFGIIFKGKSIEKIPKVYKKYNDCILVNNFDKEYKLLKKYIVRKNSVQMVNALGTAICKPHKIYRAMGITDILLSRPAHDRKTPALMRRYRKIGLNPNPYPKESMRFTMQFGNTDIKYWNTGIAAIIYVLDWVKPKHIWLVGLDFYQSDYLCRRPHQAPFELQNRRSTGYGIKESFIKIIVKQNPNTQFHIVTYQKFPEIANLEVI